MEKRDANEWILQTGGTITAGQIVVGRHNVTIVTADVAEVLQRRGMDAVEEQLKRLEGALNAHLHQLPDGGSELATLASKVATELAKPKPNKPTVSGILQQIAEAAKSVSSIVTSAEALKHVVMLLPW